MVLLIRKEMDCNRVILYDSTLKLWKNCIKSSVSLTFIVPILTMRTIAEERKAGTEQLLLTSPLSITKVVIGKFIAATLIVVITELCTFMYFAILSFFGTPHITTALVTLLGFLLLAISYISFGILASSITENQIIAAILTIAFLVIPWFLPDIPPQL